MSLAALQAVAQNFKNVLFRYVRHFTVHSVTVLHKATFLSQWTWNSSLSQWGLFRKLCQLCFLLNTCFHRFLSPYCISSQTPESYLVCCALINEERNNETRSLKELKEIIPDEHFDPMVLNQQAIRKPDALYEIWSKCSGVQDRKQADWINLFCWP